MSYCSPTPSFPRSPDRRARRAALVVLGVTLGTLTLVAPSPSTAAAPPPTGLARQEPEPSPGDQLAGSLPELAPELVDVPVSSEDYDAAVAHRDRLVDERTAAQQVITEKSALIRDLSARETALTAEIDEARAQARRWEAEAVEIAESVRDIAIDSYISGRSDSLDPVFTFDVEAHQRMATEDVTIGSLSERRSAELERARRNAHRNREVEQISTALREGVRRARAEAQIVRDRATADVARLEIDLIDAEAAVVAESRLARVEGADFPLVVLDAYWKGARLMADTGCGIPWWALAGIGRVESRHGTYSGGEVRPDGSLTRPVIGIPLTGFGGTAAIGDSDGGAIDGDPSVDRAAGPMQFIPQTWARWGRDGDGNGAVEIQNIYDAAASAAAYLCASGPMADDAGLERGYFSYNHSLAYVASVLGHAKDYAASVAI